MTLSLRGVGGEYQGGWVTFQRLGQQYFSFIFLPFLVCVHSFSHFTLPKTCTLPGRKHRSNSCQRECFLETVKSGSHFERKVPFPCLSGNLLSQYLYFQCLNALSSVLAPPERCICNGGMLWNRAQSQMQDWRDPTCRFHYGQKRGQDDEGDDPLLIQVEPKIVRTCHWPLCGFKCQRSSSA